MRRTKIQIPLPPLLSYIYIYMSYFVRQRFVCWNPKSFSYKGTVGTFGLLWFDPFGHQNAQSAILCQNDQNVPSQLRVDQSQNWSKLHQNIIFHFSTSNPRLLESLSTLTYSWLFETMESWLLIWPSDRDKTNAIANNI